MGRVPDVRPRQRLPVAPQAGVQNLGLVQLRERHDRRFPAMRRHVRARRPVATFAARVLRRFLCPKLRSCSADSCRTSTRRRRGRSCKVPRPQSRSWHPSAPAPAAQPTETGIKTRRAGLHSVPSRARRATVPASRQYVTSLFGKRHPYDYAGCTRVSDVKKTGNKCKLMQISSPETARNICVFRIVYV